ncbi:MAG: aminotransferase class III-fold pyridoxal phosphate-dependent enzyme [Ilumatobacter sp.]|nr:aminotransferase class III-fold pyridoxal phosphate-dependent enzyme [Ilumatobacter sp.]
MVAWDPSLEQDFGIIARGQNVGLGTTSGYVLTLDVDEAAIYLSRLDNEAAATLAKVELIMDVGKTYRFRLSAIGNKISAGVSEADAPGEELVILEAEEEDGYTEGVNGFFTNSGVESNECAIKLARKHGGRGRHTIVSTLGSFHGRTLATLAATGQPTKHEPFQPMPAGFHHVPWGDIDAIRAAVDGSVAAVLIEPIQGEGGVHPATAEYFRAVREICDDAGALMMVDEIQTGFARTGRWFGFEHTGISPDVVTLAKAMGNGMPVGACWARTDVAAVFEPGDHGSTYSGTAIACSAVNAVIDEMQRLDAPALAERKGAHLVDGLRALHGVIGVRGAGLMLGVELAEGLDAKQAYVDLLDAGLIVNAVSPTTIRLLPPLTVSDDELDEAIAMIDDALNVQLHEADA